MCHRLSHSEFVTSLLRLDRTRFHSLMSRSNFKVAVTRRSRDFSSIKLFLFLIITHRAIKTDLFPTNVLSRSLVLSSAEHDVCGVLREKRFEKEKKKKKNIHEKTKETRRWPTYCGNY